MIRCILTCTGQPWKEGKVDVLSQNRDQFEVQLTPNNNTLLHISALFGNIQCVNEILKNCPLLLNGVNINGETALHFAAREGHVATVEAVVECAKGMDKEERERGVEWAKEIVRMVNENGDTALHEAVMNRQLDVVKVLVREEDAGHLYEWNKGGESPLYVAAENGLDGCVAEILKAFVSPSYAGPQPYMLQ